MTSGALRGLLLPASVNHGKIVGGNNSHVNLKICVEVISVTPIAIYTLRVEHIKMWDIFPLLGYTLAYDAT